MTTFSGRSTAIRRGAVLLRISRIECSSMATSTRLSARATPTRLMKSRIAAGGTPRRRRPASVGMRGSSQPSTCPFAHQLGQHPLGQHRVAEIEPRELVLPRPRRHRQVLDQPVVERPVVVEFERAERMRDALDRVGLAVGEVVARIDRPVDAGARMARVEDAVEHRVAEVDVARGHVDLGAQHPRAVRELAGPHAAEEVEVLLDAPLAEGAVRARLGQRPARQPHLLLRLVVDIGLAGPDQVLGPLVELLEIVGGVVEVLAPVEAEPAHVALDRVDVLLLLLGRIGVVEAQAAMAAELLRHAEIEADRLGVADMEVAVRLRRKARHHLARPPGGEVGADDVADEVLSRLADGWRLHSSFAAGLRFDCASSAKSGQRGQPCSLRSVRQFARNHLATVPAVDTKMAVASSTRPRAAAPRSSLRGRHRQGLIGTSRVFVHQRQDLLLVCCHVERYGARFPRSKQFGQTWPARGPQKMERLRQDRHRMFARAAQTTRPALAAQRVMTISHRSAGATRKLASTSAIARHSPSGADTCQRCELRSAGEPFRRIRSDREIRSKDVRRGCFGSVPRSSRSRITSDFDTRRLLRLGRDISHEIIGQPHIYALHRLHCTARLSALQYADARPRPQMIRPC